VILRIATYAALGLMALAMGAAIMIPSL